MVLGIFLSVAVLLLWGLGDYLLGKSGLERDVQLTNVIQSIVGIVVMLPLGVAFGFTFNLQALLIISFIAFLSAAAYDCYIRAFSIGSFGVVAPIANSYPVVTVFIGLVFLAVPLSLVQLLSLAIIIAGVFMLSIDRGFSFRVFLLERSTLLALGAALGWGTGFILFDLVIATVSWFELYFFLAIFQSFFALIFYIVGKRSLPPLRDFYYDRAHYAWKAGLLLSAGFAIFFVAISLLGTVVIPAVIASASPLVICFLAYFKDGEHLSLSKKLGVVSIVIGIMLLNFVS